MVTYVFDLTLSDSSPRVWRRLSLPGRYRLSQVHKMMQILYGFKNCHTHNFQIGSTTYSDPDPIGGSDGDRDEKIRLQAALGDSTTFRYRYDFGDSWEIVALLRETLPIDRDGPECLDGALAGPPEDCGGIPGFEELKSILKNPRHPQHQEMTAWAPKGYDPDAFSKEVLTKKLLRSFARKKPREAL